MSSTLAILQGIHTGLAYFGGPHWLLDDDDGKRYAVAVANVARHYDIEVAQKTVDWLNLLGIAAYIEGTRFLHGRMGQRQPQRPRQAGQVVPIFSFQTPPAGGPAMSTPSAPSPFGMSPQAPQTDLPPEGPIH